MAALAAKGVTILTELILFRRAPRLFLRLSPTSEIHILRDDNSGGSMRADEKIAVKAIVRLAPPISCAVASEMFRAQRNRPQRVRRKQTKIAE